MIGIDVLLMLGFSFGNINTEMCNESRYYINNIDDFESLKTCDIIDGNLFINAENNLDYYPYASEVATERRHMIDFIGKLQNELRVREMRPHKVTT